MTIKEIKLLVKNPKIKVVSAAISLNKNDPNRYDMLYIRLNKKEILAALDDCDLDETIEAYVLNDETLYIGES